MKLNEFYIFLYIVIFVLFRSDSCYFSARLSDGGLETIVRVHGARVWKLS